MPPSICILTHEHHRFADAKLGDAHYIAADLAELWRARGHRVDIQRGLPADRTPRAEICFVHVDLTRTPDDYQRFACAHRWAVNARCPDIAKRVVSTGLVGPNDQYDGPVMVKTDLNYGGMGEGQALRRSSAVAKYLRRARRRLPWALQREMDVHAYRVFESPRAVPALVWRNRSLVVERLFTEQREGYFWLRTWVFLGDRGLLRFFGSSERVVKGKAIAVRTFEDPENPAMLPPEVRARREALGLDFGKIDYIVADDGAHVIDANRTVTTRLEGDRLSWQTELLAPGLDTLCTPTMPA